MTGNSTLPLLRFDGAAAWAKLSQEERDEIGALALELVVTCHGEDAHFTGHDAEREARPFLAVGPLVQDRLKGAVDEALREELPALFDDESPIPIPSALGPVCRVCLCSEEDPCEAGCGWADADVCTACAERGGSQ
jgi:hypothetical protein